MKQTDPVPTLGSSEPGRQDRPCPNQHMNTSIYNHTKHLTGTKHRLHWDFTPAGGKDSLRTSILAEFWRLEWNWWRGRREPCRESWGQRPSNPCSAPQGQVGAWASHLCSFLICTHSDNSTSLTELFCNQDAITWTKNCGPRSSQVKVGLAIGMNVLSSHLSMTPSPLLVVSLCLSVAVSQWRTLL